MSIGAISNIIHRSRKEMLSMEATEHAEMFEEKFGLKSGDYVEVGRARGAGSWTKARILTVEQCWFNANGGYTATITVLPLLMSGRVGNSRSVHMSIDRHGKQNEKQLPSMWARKI